MLIAHRHLRLAVVFMLSVLPCFAHAAEVELFSPSGEVKKVRQVAVRFPEQMVAFGDPREVNPFDITCPAAGKGRWADQRNWIYDFEQDLPAGVACSFSVKKGLASLKGNAIKANTYSFNTGGPAVMQSEPYSGETPPSTKTRYSCSAWMRQPRPIPYKRMCIAKPTAFRSRYPSS